MSAPTNFSKVCTHAYQPVVSLRDGRVHHYEALTRLINSDQNIGEWIAGLERAGVIGWLDRHNVVEIAAAAERSGAALAVNVSAATAQDPDFHGHVARVLATMHAPERLQFEITETEPIVDVEAARAFIETVQHFGCQVAIDDYGVGFTSPAMIRELSPNAIKFDMAVVQGLRWPDRRRDAERIVRGAQREAGMIGASLVAEGIDTPSLIGTLRLLGIEHGQGFLLGKPSRDLPRPGKIIPIQRLVSAEPAPELALSH